MDPQTLQLPRIFSVFIQVRDLDHALSFYRDVLGLEVEQNDSALAILRSRGDTTHTLVLREIGDRDRHGLGEAGVTRIGWQVKDSADLDAAEELLARHAVQYRRQRGSDFDSITTRDPDGLRIVLFRADETSLAKAPPAAMYWYE
ncbi:MAG: VOC family protein [Actinobacteria bacterium]|nr:VOC family protein [Actinomycetota bacterium]